MEILSERSKDILSAQKRTLLMRLRREQERTQTTERDSSLPTIVPDPAHRYEPFPLTEIQQAYWIGRSAIYEFGDISIHAYVEVEGNAIDLARLEGAWQQIVVRHDMLRAIVLPDGQQQILEEVPLYAFQIVDLREQGAEIASSTLAAIRDELSQQVLKAEAWPGFDIRASLLVGGRTRIHISIDLLHVDAGSLMILIDEWMRLYQDTTASLPQFELSYRDYVLSESTLHESKVYQQSLDYWRERVATLPPPPELPGVQAQDPSTRTRFRRRSATLQPESWQQLKLRATQAGLTPSAVLLTAYAEILASWSKNPAFTLNVTLFNRLPLHSQVNSILGDFTSMILLEAANAPETTFVARGKQVQKELWSGMEHRFVSGVQVLRELAKVQKKTTGVLMPVVFTSMLDLAAQGFRPPFSSLRSLGEVVYSITQTPQVWLDHQVLEDDGALVLTWDTVEDIFPAGLLDDMLAAYLQLLQRLAEDATAWQDQCHTHPPQAQLAQRIALNATDAPIPVETPFTLVSRRAALQPDHPAIITSNRMLTYSEVCRRANQLGHRLLASGAQPNTLVAVVMEKGWEQVEATLGIHAAGAAYVPIDPELPLERRNYLFEHSEVQFAVTQSWLDQRLEWPAGIQRICIDNDELTFEDDTPLEPMQGPGDLSYVIYTSGSTGMPKGVMIEHGTVVNRIIDVNQRLGVGPADRVLALTALYHDMSVYDIFGILAAGGTLVIPEASHMRDPAHWAELMAREHVTLWNSVPAFLQMLVEYLEQRTDCPELLPHSLRAAILSGDWIPVTLPDRLRSLVAGVQIITSGGATETTIWDVWYQVGKVDASWQSIPYGKPMTNARYYVLNRSMEPCPVWVPGHLYSGGVGLARGYWRDEEKTRERFITHPQTGERIYRSGDMGRYLPDGNIEFLGREDFQVKIRGYRIELGEIEAALQQHPAVGTAVVSAIGEPRGLQRLVAYIVPKPGVVPPAASPFPAGKGKSQADFRPDQLAGIAVLDPIARIDFKLNRWGIRRDSDCQVVQFPHPEPDEALLQAYTERRTVHDFAPDPIPFTQFGEFLRCLASIEMVDLPKYRYASGGGLYPIQTYLYIKPARIEGIAGGVYYYHPKHHQLLLMSSEARLDHTTQMPHNRVAFDQAAFVVFLIGQLQAIEPLYGAELARDFCLLEAGYMSQLLMTVAPAAKMGLCPIGSMEFEPIRSFFHLEESHILTHILFGGQLASEQNTQGISVDERVQTPETVSHAQGEGNDLVAELRAFAKQKLPEQMLPSAYVLLETLPLTSNGKVERRLLPLPEEVTTDAMLSVETVPRNDVERTLITIVQQVLHIEQVGIHQNFFELGGNSIHMVQILNKLRETFQREIPITEIFRRPTISSLAAYLNQGEEEESEQSFAQSDEHASERRASLVRHGAQRREHARHVQEGDTEG